MEWVVTRGHWEREVVRVGRLSAVVKRSGQGLSERVGGEESRTWIQLSKDRNRYLGLVHTYLLTAIAF